MKKANSIFLLFTLCFSSNVFADMPKDSLLLHLPFNGSIVDESGNAHELKLHGTMFTEDRLGSDQNALYFNGQGDYIDISELGDSLFSNDYTISIVCAFSNFYNSYPSLIAGENNYLALHGTGQKYNSNMSKIAYYQGPNDQPDNRRVPAFLSQTKITPTQFNHITIVKNVDTVSMFINGILDTSVIANNLLEAPKGDNLYIGTGARLAYDQFFNGIIDEIAIYNKALSDDEMLQLRNELYCNEVIYNDTTTYYVSSQEFEAISPVVKHLGTDTLMNNTLGCTNLVHKFAKFEYNPEYCSETYVDTVTVTGTLEVHFNTTGVNQQFNASIKIYPNPTKKLLIIQTDYLTELKNYTIRISNSMGQTVYNTFINQSEIKIDSKDIGTTGLYFINFEDGNGKIVESRKLLIQ